MGAIVPGRTTIGGVLTAPGIPLNTSPLTGLFNDAGNVGVVVTGNKHLSIGPLHTVVGSAEAGDVLTVDYINAVLKGANVNGVLTINTVNAATVNDLVAEPVTSMFDVAMVANAGVVDVIDNKYQIVNVSGALTAAGLITLSFLVNVVSINITFNNSTTGAFPLELVVGALPFGKIPRGLSNWYWNGASMIYVSGGGYDTPNVTPMPAAGAVVTAAHYLGVTPSLVNLEAICLTAENGYAINDVVNVAAQATAGLVLSPLSFYKDVTIVGFTLIAGNQIAIMNAATGAYVLPTAANWAYRFGVDR